MGYEVRGGPGSIKFSVTELERTITMLGRAASELMEGTSTLARMPVFPAAMLALGPLTMRGQVLAAVRGVAEAAGMCTARAAETTALAVKVSTARFRYEQTEALVGYGINAVRGTLLPLAVMRDLAENKGRPRTETTEDMINQLPEFLGLPFSLLRDLEHGGAFEAPLADRLYPQLTDLLTGQNLLHLGPIDIRGQAPECVMEFDGTVESLMELQQLAEREPPGSLLVTRIDAPEGPVYVVTIPGTQSDPLREMNEDVKKLGGAGPQEGMENPWDGIGIVEGMGNDSKNLRAPVEDALRDSGAKDGDLVVVTGYSQGGIHAVNIVNDERLNKLFRFEYLTTFGSPTGQLPVPRDTHALHLEDRNDPVPGTDGSRNPDDRNRLTVIFDGLDGSRELGNDGFGEAHKLDNYESHIQELRGSPDPGVTESLGLLGLILGGRRQGKIRSYQLGRRPKPKMVLPKTNKKHEGFYKSTPGK